MNQAIHSVDLLTWLMGPVVEVRALTATLAHERIEVEDAAVATLRFANGALGVIEATTAVYPGYLKRIEIHGTAGSAVLEEEDFKAWDFAKPRKEDQAIRDAMAKPKSTAGGASDPAAIGHHGHARQFQDFVDSIRKRRRPAIDGQRGPPLRRNHPRASISRPSRERRSRCHSKSTQCYPAAASRRGSDSSGQSRSKIARQNLP